MWFIAMIESDAIYNNYRIWADSADEAEEIARLYAEEGLEEGEYLTIFINEYSENSDGDFNMYEEIFK